jgi:hypothetical protein
MKRLIFKKYNAKIDTSNIKERLFGKVNFGQKISNNIYPFTLDFIKKLKLQPTKKQDKMISKFLASKQLQIILENQRKLINKLWSKKLESEYFNSTKKFLNIALDGKDCFKAYFTYVLLCAYYVDKKYFFISAWNSPLYHINIIAHELLHLLFIKNYKKYCIDQGLTENQFENLKEALTFILNEKEYKKIVIVRDNGYPDHKKFRQFLSKRWNKKRNFSELLACGCEYSKKHFPK